MKNRALLLSSTALFFLALTCVGLLIGIALWAR